MVVEIFETHFVEYIVLILGYGYFYKFPLNIYFFVNQIPFPMDKQ